MSSNVNALNDNGDSVMVTMSKWPSVQFGHRYNIFHFLSIFLPGLVIFGVFVFGELIFINNLILYNNFYSYAMSFYLKWCVRFVELQVTINLIAFRALNYKDHIEYQLNRLDISEVKLRKLAVQKIMHSGEHLYANKRCLICDRCVWILLLYGYR
ncbi:unnamed protein product, partial [Mesorhabditis belari]|uniref:Uncharacterized protein n=1 Tax=Mesorhabditis belari TaxID=2138241 RepID=A0AAF3FDA5_9BILA